MKDLNNTQIFTLICNLLALVISLATVVFLIVKHRKKKEPKKQEPKKQTATISGELISLTVNVRDLEIIVYKLYNDRIELIEPWDGVPSLMSKCQIKLGLMGAMVTEQIKKGKTKAEAFEEIENPLKSIAKL